MTPERLCGLCQLPLSAGEVGIRYFGMYTAHSEHRCRELLRMEIDRFRASHVELCAMWRCTKGHVHNQPYGDGCPMCRIVVADARVKQLEEALKVAREVFVTLESLLKGVNGRASTALAVLERTSTALDRHATQPVMDVAEQPK